MTRSAFVEPRVRYGQKGYLLTVFLWLNIIEQQNSIRVAVLKERSR